MITWIIIAVQIGFAVLAATGVAAMAANWDCTKSAPGECNPDTAVGATAALIIFFIPAWVAVTGFLLLISSASRKPRCTRCREDLQPGYPHCIACGHPAPPAPPTVAPWGAPPAPGAIAAPPPATAPRFRSYRRRSRDTAVVAVILIAAAVFSWLAGPWTVFGRAPACHNRELCNFELTDWVGIGADLLFLAAWAIGVLGVCFGAVTRRPKWPWALGGLLLVIVSTVVVIVGLLVSIDPSLW